MQTESQQTSICYCEWQSDKFKYQDSQIREIILWIKTNKGCPSPSMIMLEQNIDLSTFPEGKRHVYEIIKTHSEEPHPKEPLLLIITGVGCTGTSYLPSTIQNLLQHSCGVTFHTGKASFSMGSLSIHY